MTAPTDNAALRAALDVAKRAILKAAQDTLWCDDTPAETVIDRIDSLIAEAEGQTSFALAAAIPTEQDGYAEGRARDREAMVRAMYDAWPHTVISEALSEVFGLPVGTVLTYELARAGGADFKGLERFADAIAAMPPTDRHAEGRIAGLEEAAKVIEKMNTNNVGMVHPVAAAEAKAIRTIANGGTAA